MAKEIITRLRDDITGELIEEGHGETIQFGFGGRNYSIDLNDDNANEFRKFMSKYADKATEEVAHLPRERRASSSSSSSNKEELQKIRAWAREEGLQVSDRGRVSAEIQAAYHKANS